MQTSRSYLKDRVKDQTIIQTYINDKSVIQSFVEVNEFGEAKEVEEPVFDMDGEGEHGIQATGELEKSKLEETKKEEIGELKEAEGEGEIEKEQTPHEDTVSEQAIHLIKRQDLSVTKITGNGEA